MIKERLDTSRAQVLVGSQADWSTPATNADYALRLIGDGGFSLEKEVGEVEYNDQELFGRGFSHVKTVAATAELTVACTPEAAAYLFARHYGNEAVSGDVREATSADANPAPLTIWQPVGVGDLEHNTVFIGAIIKSVELDGTQGNDDAVVLKLEILAVRSATYDKDPTVLNPTQSRQFAWPDVSGSIVVDGITLRGGKQLILRSDNGATIEYGDSVTAHSIRYGDRAIELTVGAQPDEEALKTYCKLVYGVEEPTAGAEPIHTVEEFAVSYEFSNNKAGDDLRSVAIDLPAVALVAQSDPIYTQDGAYEFEFAGRARKAEDGTAAITVTTTLGDESGS